MTQIINGSSLAYRLAGAAARAEAHGMTRLAAMMTYAGAQMENGNEAFAQAVFNLKRTPPSMEEFLDSKEYYADQYEVLWPKARERLLEICPDIMLGAPPVLEYYDGGATGTAKSFVAMTTQLYHTTVLTCFKRPQALFELAYHTPLVIMMQSVSDKVTRRVLYEPFRTVFTNMPYVKRYVQYDRYKENSLYLEGNIQVVPALAQVTDMVGQAIISAVEDEVSFWPVVANSVKALGTDGTAGMFDQAEIVTRTLVRRRKSRFITQGPSPGCIAIMSSVRYKGDFISRRLKECEENPSENRKFYQCKQYEVQPPEKYVLPRFKLLVGTESYPTRILDEERDVQGEHYPDNAEVLEIPGEFLEDFKFNPESALRDVCGIASGMIKPYITRREKIVDAILRWREAGYTSWVHKQNVELAYDGLPQINEEALPTNRQVPRFVHIDLSKTKDRCGIAIVRVPGFVNISRDGHVERLPYYIVEDAWSIKPSATSELDISEVRNWVMQLRSFWGFNIVGVTYDGFQSQESILAWRKIGVWSEVVSMDRDTDAYDIFKQAMYDDRLDMADNELARTELTTLEVNEKTGMIDHPKVGSKDIADAIAGAVKAASMSRMIRNQVDVHYDDGSEIEPEPVPRPAGVRR